MRDFLEDLSPADLTSGTPILELALHTHQLHLRALRPCAALTRAPGPSQKLPSLYLFFSSRYVSILSAGYAGSGAGGYVLLSHPRYVRYDDSSLSRRSTRNFPGSRETSGWEHRRQEGTVGQETGRGTYFPDQPSFPPSLSPLILGDILSTPYISLSSVFPSFYG